jgi:hypothetical protein
MTPHGKLLMANILMLVGIVPLILGISWILAAISYVQQHKGEMGGSDAFLIIAVLIVTYAFAAVVAGSSALWSGSIMRRNAGLRSGQPLSWKCSWAPCWGLLYFGT